MTTVYAVFRQGQYRHECGGIFTDPDRAVKCAEALAEADVDNHHSYDVVPFNLDESLEVGGVRLYMRGGSPKISEREPIFSASKKMPE